LPPIIPDIGTIIWANKPCKDDPRRWKDHPMVVMIPAKSDDPAETMRVIVCSGSEYVDKADAGILCRLGFGPNKVLTKPTWAICDWPETVRMDELLLSRKHQVITGKELDTIKKIIAKLVPKTP